MKPPGSERGALLTLAAVHFTHVMDLIIMMPLGESLMRQFAITPAQFTYLVATYGLAAAFTGLLGGFVIDKLDRKSALLAGYAGFALATLACAFAPNYGLLFAARFAAGAFGGLVGSLSNAMVGDLVPPERRGRAIGLVMTGWPLGSALGVPAALITADLFDWHGPFVLIAMLSVPVWWAASRALPRLPPAKTSVHAGRQMREILRQPAHRWGFLLSASLMFTPACILPFMAASTVANAGLGESQLKFIYVCSGTVTFFTTALFGRLSDRFDKLPLIAGVAPFAIAVILVLTRLGRVPVPLVLLMTTLFYVSISSLNPPVMTMIVNAVEARYREGFMSVNAAIQQAAAGLANILAGLLVVRDSAGHLTGYPTVGHLAAGSVVLTVVLARRLRTATLRTPDIATRPLVSLPEPVQPA